MGSLLRYIEHVEHTLSNITMLKECLLQSVECELLQQYSALVGYPSNIAHPVSYPSNIAVR